jgi:hypothetical protein
MPEVEYELRGAGHDEIVATGRLTLDAEAEVGQHLAIGSQQGIIRSVFPPIGDHLARVVVQLLLPARNPAA